MNRSPQLGCSQHLLTWGIGAGAVLAARYFAEPVAAWVYVLGFIFVGGMVYGALLNQG